MPLSKVFQSPQGFLVSLSQRVVAAYSVPQGASEGFEVPRFLAQEEEIDTRLESLANRVLPGVSIAYRCHVQIITAQHPLKPEAFPQPLLVDDRRERGGPFGIEIRIERMGSHDTLDTFVDGGSKRDKVPFPGCVIGPVNDRRMVVRVEPSLTKPGKMLGGGGNAVFLEGADPDSTQASDLLRIGTQ
jgi:hypothetical protein